MVCTFIFVYHSCCHLLSQILLLPHSSLILFQRKYSLISHSMLNQSTDNTNGHLTLQLINPSLILLSFICLTLLASLPLLFSTVPAFLLGVICPLFRHSTLLERILNSKDINQVGCIFLLPMLSQKMRKSNY